MNENKLVFLSGIDLLVRSGVGIIIVTGFYILTGTIMGLVVRGIKKSNDDVMKKVDETNKKNEEFIQNLDLKFKEWREGTETFFITKMQIYTETIKMLRDDMKEYEKKTDNIDKRVTKIESICIHCRRLADG